MATADPILRLVGRLLGQLGGLNIGGLTLNTHNFGLDVMDDLLVAYVDLEQFTNRMHVQGVE